MTIRISLFFVLTIFALNAFPKTPQEVFSITSKSVVVVKVFDENLKPTATGSGVVVGKGEIITNCHVVQAGKRYEVGREGSSNPATVLYADVDSNGMDAHFLKRHLSAKVVFPLLNT